MTIRFMDRLAVYSVKDYIKENMVLNDCENYLKGICNLARFSLNKTALTIRFFT